jgi:hypothetical protein
MTFGATLVNANCVMLIVSIYWALINSSHIHKILLHNNRTERAL